MRNGERKKIKHTFSVSSLVEQVNVMGLIISPSLKAMLKYSLLVPMNVTLFGNRVFADVSEDPESILN